MNGTEKGLSHISPVSFFHFLLCSSVNVYIHLYSAVQIESNQPSSPPAFQEDLLRPPAIVTQGEKEKKRESRQRQASKGLKLGRFVGPPVTIDLKKKPVTPIQSFGFTP